jgi:hypothetical protein
MSSTLTSASHQVHVVLWNLSVLNRIFTFLLIYVLFTFLLLTFAISVFNFQLSLQLPHFELGWLLLMVRTMDQWTWILMWFNSLTTFKLEILLGICRYSMHLFNNWWKSIWRTILVQFVLKTHSLLHIGAISSLTWMSHWILIGHFRIEIRVPKSRALKSIRLEIHSRSSWWWLISDSVLSWLILDISEHQVLSSQRIFIMRNSHSFWTGCELIRRSPFLIYKVLILSLINHLHQLRATPS